MSRPYRSNSDLMNCLLHNLHGTTITDPLHEPKRLLLLDIAAGELEHYSRRDRAQEIIEDHSVHEFGVVDLDKTLKDALALDHERTARKLQEQNCEYLGELINLPPAAVSDLNLGRGLHRVLYDTLARYGLHLGMYVPYRRPPKKHVDRKKHLDHQLTRDDLTNSAMAGARHFGKTLGDLVGVSKEDFEKVDLTKDQIQGISRMLNRYGFTIGHNTTIEPSPRAIIQLHTPIDLTVLEFTRDKALAQAADDKGIYHVRDIVHLDGTELLNLSGMGKKRLKAIQKELGHYDLTLEMSPSDIDSWVQDYIQRVQ